MKANIFFMFGLGRNQPGISGERTEMFFFLGWVVCIFPGKNMGAGVEIAKEKKSLCKVNPV